MITLLATALQIELARRPYPRVSRDLLAALVATRSRSLVALATGSPVFLVAGVSASLSPQHVSGIRIDLYGVLYAALAAAAWWVATRPRAGLYGVATLHR